MRVQVLHVPDCPGTATLLARLACVLAGRTDVDVEQELVHDAAGAARLGMTGSPTLLLNGDDPFAPPGVSPSLSCRLYRDEGGAPSPAPSLAQLRAAIDGKGNRDGR